MSGVMRRSLCRLMFVVLMLAPGYVLRAETVAGLPAPTGYVDDFAGVLSPETKQSMEDLCTQVDQKAHAQIAVVTVKTIDPGKVRSAVLLLLAFFALRIVLTGFASR